MRGSPNSNEDIYVYRSVLESGVGEGNRDQLLGFGYESRIDLRAIDADGDASNGDTAFTLIQGAFTNQPGQLRGDYVGLNRYLISADVDGDGLADMEILAMSGPQGTPLVPGYFFL